MSMCPDCELPLKNENACACGWKRFPPPKPQPHANQYGRDFDHFLASREWRTIRMRVLERDGGKCACCGATAKIGVVLNVDHIKPRIRYPELALTMSNLQVLCDACNQGKGNRYETDWRGSEKQRASQDGEARRITQLDGVRRMTDGDDIPQ